MPAFSHFFLKRLSARSKFSFSLRMTSDTPRSPVNGGTMDTRGGIEL